MSALPQFTVAGDVRLEGVGLHTGETGLVTVAPSDRGRISFTHNGSRIPADVDQVTNTERCTVLGNGSWGVSTVEHLLAAMSALGVSSADVSVEGPEIPALDGSATGFVRALRGVGVTSLGAGRPVLWLREPTYLESGLSRLVALPSDVFRLTVVIRYDHPLVGAQVFDAVVEPEFFVREIAPARTFGFLEELGDLERAGLARGGSIDNAVLFTPSATSTPLRFPNEPVRHKALDMIGDLSLLGAVPMAHIIAIRPSHRLNVEFARLLRREAASSPQTT